MTDSPHVLVLAPPFPASEGPVPAAALRSRGLARAFATLGYRVDVVCAMPAHAGPIALRGVTVHPVGWVDPDRIARDVFRGRLGTADERFPGAAVLSRVIPPDRFVSWIPGAVRRARPLIEPSTLVFSTGARSAHLAALRLGVGPRIVDLNDPWVGNPHMPVGRLRARVHQRLERLALEGAALITTVTPPLAEAIGHRYGHDRVHTVLSGFEPGDWWAVAPTVWQVPTLLYAGTVYDGFDLAPLYNAILEGARSGILAPDRLRLRFVGRLNERVAAEAYERGIEAFFDVLPSVSRREILSQVGGATALLLPLYDDDPYALPMKFFEYLGSHRPIVALGPSRRYAGRLLAERGFGVVASSVTEVGAILEQIVRDPGSLPHATVETAAGFTWEATTEGLRRVLDQLG